MSKRQITLSTQGHFSWHYRFDIDSGVTLIRDETQFGALNSADLLEAMRNASATGIEDPPRHAIDYLLTKLDEKYRQKAGQADELPVRDHHFLAAAEKWIAQFMASQ